MARSISPASCWSPRILTGLASTPSVGATRLDRAELARPGSSRQIAKHRRTLDTGCDLLEQLQPSAAHAVFEVGEAGGVAAGVRQSLDKTATDRIGDLYEYDRHNARGLQNRPGGRTANGHNNVGCRADQLRCIPAFALAVAAHPARVDMCVVPLGPTQLRQALQERG